MKTVRIGLDVGGTFTDVVAVSDDGRLVHQKRRSQPDDPARSVHRCISDALADLGAPPDTVRFLGHGTTIVTNLIIEGAGDPVALVTTAGFRDVLDLDRQARPHVYDYRVARPASPAHRRDRFEVSERAGPEGPFTPLDDAALDAIADTLAERGAIAIAVCFLHSYRHPGHERQAVAHLRARLPEVYVTASHDVAPEYREFERFSTTALNASVGPRAMAYLTRLEAGLRAEGVACPFYTVTSNAGLVDPATVRRMPVRTALSGPAAGVAGIGRMLSQEGFGDLITFDMGGTSTDIAVLRQGAPGQARTREVAGHPILAPMVDIDVIGAGGGSLVRVDAGGALSVGPESAGAEPGPAAYGRGGTRATVTDAAAALGLVGGGRALGGVLTLDRAAAEAALARDVAVPLDLSLVAAADGVMAVAGASIARAVRSAAVRRGIDPADATLVAFGGAGPMLATRVADSLGIARIAVPAAPGTLCARAILVSDLARDFSVTHPLELSEAAGPGLAAAFAALEAEGRAWLAGEGIAAEHQRLERDVEARYLGQSFEVAVPFDPSAPLSEVLASFHARHEESQGFRLSERGVEAVTLRLRASAAAAEMPPPTGGDGPPVADAWRAVSFGEAPVMTRILDRMALATGGAVEGPAIIEEDTATTIVAPGWQAVATPSGTLVLSRVGGP